jgi:hypothetical protein
MMTKTLIALVSVASVLAVPASAAPARQRAQQAPAVQSTGQYQYPSAAPRNDIVVFGNQIIGQDPDANIRTQMLHDPVPYNND